MKIQLLFAVAMISINALATELPVKACYMEHDKKIGDYQAQVTVSESFVSVAYVSKTVPNLGGYSGSIIGKVENKNGVIKVENQTLNDGEDGWLDDMTIEITDRNVLFVRKGDKDKAQPRVECWSK